MLQLAFACLAACLFESAAFAPSSVKPGTKGWGYVPVLESLTVNAKLPVMIIRGANAGPTFTITGGLYPTEFCGVEAATRLYQQLEPANMTGTVVIIPVANMQVLQFRTPMLQLTESITPMDGKMLATVFPGDPKGSITEVIADAVFGFVQNSSYHVDLRGGDLGESHMLHTIVLQGMGREMDSTTKDMCLIFGMEYCRESRKDVFDTKPGTLIYEAIAKGVPSMISEAGLGYNQQPADSAVQMHVTGVFNLLKWAKILPGMPSPPTKTQSFLAADFVDVKTTSSGIFKHSPDEGAAVQKGERVGAVCDLDGTVLETLYAPCDAIVHEMMPKRVVFQGDCVYTLAIRK